ncbi:prolyl 3-hydroxylase 1 isoform X4 [Dromaius novaehollandiae]
MALPLPLLLLVVAAVAEGGSPPPPPAAPPPPPPRAEPPLPAEPPDALFAAGSEAYARGDWAAVILHMERALRARGAVRARLVRCRLRCANATAWPEEPPPEPAPEPVLRDLLFFRQLLRRAACLRGCGPAAPSRYRLGDELDLEFRKRSPYNYLQVAYFKINKIAKAVAAAHTFFVANPEHAEMRQNLEYYQMMAGVKEDDFADLEARPHLTEFRLGVRFYTEEQPPAAILHLEKALEEYFVADTECRALCEGPYDYEGYNYLEYNADLFQAMTDHYMQVLSCKQGCVTELASQPGRDKPLEDFLPSHFNYLQFAYYNNGNYEKAVECAKTYLLFFPNDEVMNQNLAYYTAVLGEKLAGPIEPREEIQAYRQRSLMEKELLFFSYDVFGIPFVDPDTWTPEEVIPKRLREKQKWGPRGRGADGRPCAQGGAGDGGAHLRGDRQPHEGDRDAGGGEGQGVRRHEQVHPRRRPLGVRGGQRHHELQGPQRLAARRGGRGPLRRGVPRAAETQQRSRLGRGRLSREDVAPHPQRDLPRRDRPQGPQAGPGGQGAPAERPPLLQRDGEGAAHDGVLLPPGGPAPLLLLPPGVSHRHRR